MKHFTMKFLTLILFTFVSSISYGQYCTTGGPSSTNDSNLGSFDLFGANGSCINYTGCAGGPNNGVTGLEDLTLTTNANLVQGTTVSADITWGTCGGNFANAGTIWIDWNQNSIFDAAEAVHTWTGTPVVSQTVSITVPATATLGATRLRIFQEEGGAIPMSPCGTSTWGSMTDFTVTVTTAGTYCNPPTGVAVTTAGNDATVVFVSGSGTTNLEYGPTGFTPGTGTTVAGVTSPHTINSLAASTEYDVYVIDVCAGGALSCPAVESFLTPCALFSLPYSTSFEGNTNCWTQYTTDDFDWTLHSGTTTSTLGPSVASDGNEYLYTEVSSVSNGDQAIIESPELLLTGANNPAMLFDYHMYGDNAMGTMSVEIDSALTGNWISIWSKSGNQDDVWRLAEISLAGYGDTIAVRIIGSTLGCCSGDMAFDNVRFMPDYCFNSFDVSVYPLPSSATVSFSSLNGVVSMEYGFSGFAPGTGTYVSNVTSPYVITPLSPSNDYDVVLYDSCGANISDGITVAFSTPCPAAIAPYTESFEGAFTCWIQDPNDDFDWDQNTGGTTSNPGGPSGASEGSEYMYTEVSSTSNGDQAIFTSPFVNVSPLSSAALRFDYHMFGLDMGTLTVEVDSAQTGNWVTIWSMSGNQGDQWSTGLASLVGYGNEVRVRFVGDVLGCCAGDMAIDLVRIEEYCILVETAPFVEGFEYGCFAQSTMDVFDWTISGNGTPSGNTGASGPSEGNLYAFTESSSSAGVGAGDSAILMTQLIDITTLDYPELKFDYHMWDATLAQMGELRAEMSTDMGMTWTPIWSKSGDQGNAWLEGKVNLQAAGATDTIGLRFVGILGGDHDPATGNGFSWHSDMSLDNIRVDNGLAADLAITGLFNDFSSCASPGNPVAFEVKNEGFTPVADFLYGVVVNGVQITQTYTDTIHPTETALLAVSNGIDLIPGTNTLFYAIDGSSYGDLEATNDFLTETISASGYEDGDAYTNDYESGMDGWMGTGDWALGAPAATIITTAGGGAASWVTNLGGSYSANTASLLYSPCFDFSDYLSDPEVSFDIYWDIENGWDGAWLEVSTDGLSWNKVGAMGDGTNWYNANVTQQPLGDVWNGADTTSAGSGAWVNASNRIMGTAGQASVQFRFVMWSDGSTHNEGLGIDNFAINDWCPADLGLSTNVFPSTAGDQGDAGATVTPSNGTGPYTYLWSTGATTQVVDTLMGNTAYTVTVTDANGCSDVATITTTVVSDDFISSMQNLDIFPNPAQNTANVAVSFEQAVDVEVEIVNVVGQILTSTREEGLTKGDFTFDLTSYPSGVYLVRIKANNESVTRRLVITK